MMCTPVLTMQPYVLLSTVTVLGPVDLAALAPHAAA